MRWGKGTTSVVFGLALMVGALAEVAGVATPHGLSCGRLIDRCRHLPVEKCLPVSDHGRVVHFEYDRDGGEVWVSVWDKEGELVIYDDHTLTEKQRIAGDWADHPDRQVQRVQHGRDIY